MFAEWLTFAVVGRWPTGTAGPVNVDQRAEALMAQSQLDVQKARFPEETNCDYPMLIDGQLSPGHIT